ncbi:Protein RMD5 A [Amphibalanus amphitrite]|uniref:Protein RMD5 A n=1 Tax=Amphibalanus amphitrite TaxID=1232801 RepID=A0A6A4VUC1_AMPAM|nr:Protein RMD5 A [Amphibalanus amphitrite]
MEACTAVEKELDKVFEKFRDLDKENQRKVEEIINKIEEYVATLNDSDGDGQISAAKAVKIMELLAEARAIATKASTGHRELHSTVSKVGKAIDKNFAADYSVAALNPDFATSERDAKLVNEVICRHFYRTGLPELGALLVQSAQLENTESVVEPYMVINSIVEALRRRDLGPALSWAEQRTDQLHQIGSFLLFRLQKLQYTTMLQQGRVKEGILYARLHFGRVLQAYIDREEIHSQLVGEVRSLMGALAYVHVGLEKSPYAPLTSDSLWIEICDLVNAGAKAVPLLMNMKQVMQQRQVGGMWSSNDDLPIEIDVDREFRFHSVFACPILKQQATEQNPPVRLVCGHCISKDALHKLSHGNKLKCPYCPMEMNTADVKQIFF